MKRFVTKARACFVVSLLAACVGMVAGCTSPSANLDSDQQDNRSYMSQVNGLMDELGVSLDSFVDAVSRQDVVNMRTQADNAYKTLDELSNLESPEDLSDVKQSYVDGTSKLREALDGYIDLFTEINSGKFDQATYGDRIEEVQKLYDEGVDLLKQADEAAASK